MIAAKCKEMQSLDLSYLPVINYLCSLADNIALDLEFSVLNLVQNFLILMRLLIF